eukprot:4435483-Prymnesium_polylepis.1
MPCQPARAASDVIPTRAPATDAIPTRAPATDAMPTRARGHRRHSNPRAASETPWPPPLCTHTGVAWQWQCSVAGVAHQLWARPSPLRAAVEIVT